MRRDREHQLIEWREMSLLVVDHVHEGTRYFRPAIHSGTLAITKAGTSRKGTFSSTWAVSLACPDVGAPDTFEKAVARY
jgi:hypothetical protein